MDIITVCGELVVKSALMSRPRTVARERMHVQTDGLGTTTTS